jgi:pyruvate dehydrogenase E2 component (dihydrolipoamide acetyltransferase)
MTMPKPVRMPALGQTSDELKVLAWVKSPGEYVAEGDPLLEVETDKATLDVEAADSGVLLGTLHEPGDVIEAGTVIAWLGEPGEDMPVPRPATQDSGAAQATAHHDPGALTARRPAPPAVRALARDHDIDIDKLPGTGPVTRADIEAAIGSAQQGNSADGRSVAVSPGRRALARRLSRSAQIPQFSVSRTVDARRLVEVARAVVGVRYTHIMLRSIAAAVRQHQEFNRIWTDEQPSFQEFDTVNLGLAVATAGSLLVVAVPEPDLVELADLAKLTAAIVAEARAGQLRAGTLAATPVTLSNLGMFGADSFTPLLGPGQTAVLGTGRIIERPAIEDGQVRAIPQLDLTLTVDHRIADGADAARFLTAIAGQLES